MFECLGKATVRAKGFGEDVVLGSFEPPCCVSSDCRRWVSHSWDE